MKATDPSHASLSQLTGATVDAWFESGPAVFLVLGGCHSPDVSGAKLLPYRAADGSAQMGVELLSGAQLGKHLQVAQRTTGEAVTVINQAIQALE